MCGHEDQTYYLSPDFAWIWGTFSYIGVFKPFETLTTALVLLWIWGPFSGDLWRQNPRTDDAGPDDLSLAGSFNNSRFSSTFLQRSSFRHQLLPKVSSTQIKILQLKVSISGSQNLRQHQVSQFWSRWTFTTNKVGWSVFCEIKNLLQVQPLATRFPLDQLRREARAQAKV